MKTKNRLKNNRRHAVSVIIPLHNNEDTITLALKSLVSQKNSFDELIIVDDASTDQSKLKAQRFLQKIRNFHFRIIDNKKSRGLAVAYNRGIRAARGKLIITMHADVVLKPGAVAQLVAPLLDNKEVVASYHQVIHPLKTWKKYNFWQKCLFARLVEKRFSGLDGKFDCFRKSALEKVGLFDEKRFKSAGEDGDIVWKLKKVGRIVPSRATIIHLHKINANFSLKDYVYKHAQYAEAQGALFKRGRFSSVRNIPRAFFREIFLIVLLILFFLPLTVTTWFALGLILAYSFLYTKKVYLYEFSKPNILLLPFVNMFLLIVSFIYSVRGFIHGKQQI